MARRCIVCDSKQWHKEPSSGQVVCSEGHVLQNYRTEARILDEFGPHAMKKRTLKTGRKRKEKESQADPQLYHGDRARYHYFQCLQLVLRHQVKTLIELWKLPPEFEPLCRDIWSLHLNLLPNPLSAEPLLYQEETRGPKTSSRAKKPETPSTDSVSEESGDSSGEDPDPEMDALLREMSEPSSSDDDDVLTRPTPADKVHRRKERGTYEFPANNIVVMVLACWTLRIPITYMDFSRAIEEYDIPYLDVLLLLPADMKRHLTKQNAHSLSPHFSPTPVVLHALASRLAKKMYSEYGIFTPEANAAPILWRAVRCLSGTPTLYSMAKRLAATISLPLTLHHTLAPMLVVLKKDDPESHKFDNLPPEVSLIATVVVVTRLVYGLDGKGRSPGHPNDPSCAFPELSTYLRQLKDLDEAEGNEPRNVFSALNPMPLQELNDKILDEYLDFCADKAISNGEGTDAIVHDYFPVLARQDLSTSRQVTEVPIEKPVPIMYSPKQHSLHPGEAYRIYHARDVLGCVPEAYQLVVGRAARWAGVTDVYMFSVVEKFERRFWRGWKNKQKRERDQASQSILGGDDE